MQIEVSKKQRLSAYSSIGIGGEADYLIEVKTKEELLEAVSWAKENKQPIFLLGGGSNVLISDSGFRGLVIINSIPGIEEIHTSSEQIEVKVGAGENWDAFVAHCVEQNWQGIECLSGIPGKAGAAPIQNIGAYGQEIQEVFVSLEALEIETRKWVSFSKADCAFSYRDSFFKQDGKNKYIITELSLSLKKNGKPLLRYPDLKKTISDTGIENPSLKDVREAVIAVRKMKGMVLDKNDPDSRSLGSFFKNPIVGENICQQLVKKLIADNIISNKKEFPMYPGEDGKVKLSAAWLLEHSGAEKGFCFKSAGISSKHVLALINPGAATATDIKALAKILQGQLKEKFGIDLEPEPIFIGD